MTYDELSPEQKHDVKENYMIRLADEGCFIRTIYGDDANEPERGPTQGELCDADELISDEEMRELSEGVAFVAEDFLCSSPSEQWRFTPQFIQGWCDANLTTRAYEKDKDKLHVNCDITAGIQYAKDKIKDLCDRFDKGQLTADETRLTEENNGQ